MNEQDFDLSIRADGYDSEQLQNLSIVGQKEEEIIGRLQSSAPLLLEGIRGSGKTTLLKLAFDRTNAPNGRGQSLAAYVSFSRYLLLENPNIPVGPNHPFPLWVSTKILNAVYDAARNATGTAPTVPSLLPFHEFHFDAIISNLEGTHTLAANESSTLTHLTRPVQDALAALQNPERLNTVLVEVLNTFGYSSLNLLCDEAAQYFKPEFQPLFFSILKSIHTPSISFKAAVYPTLTYFGSDFELGHDASIVSITRPCLTEDWMKFCRAITDRRSRRTNLWAEKSIFLESLAFASFGIPRRFIEMVGAIDFSTATELDILNVIKSHAQRELLQPFDALKAKIPSIVREVELASYLLHLFIDDLKQENLVRTHITAYVAVSKHRALPYAIRKAMNLLVYLGVLERQAPCKLGHTRETADRLLVNPALIFAENLLADSSKRKFSLREINERLTSLELDIFKEYGRNSKALQEAVDEAISVESKPCPQCGTDLPFEARFCNNCGAPQQQGSILSHILALPSLDLELTPGIKARVTERFATVGDVLAASDSQLDALPYVGQTRVAIIRHAVDELISG